MATIDDVLAAIRHHHPDVFGPVADRQEGEAADAIRDAETALAHQNSATAQVDLQVVAAILNAHQTTVEGREALDKLQRDVETAVRSRTDLDTSAGARDFQRYLIGKLDEIRAVVARANLDDTSKSALMAAWTSLYSSATHDPGDAAQHQPVAARPFDPPSSGADQGPVVMPDTEMDPYLDALSADGPGVATGGAAAQSPPPPVSSATPTLPNPGGGAAPWPAPNGGSPGGFAIPGLPAGSAMERPVGSFEDTAPDSENLLSKDQPSAEARDDNRADDEAGERAPVSAPPAGPTTVTLPNGETVTAASPELAAVIKAAVGGTPIADAFRQQGINIPPPATAVAEPVDPLQVQPGDIGMFTTRHALALGHSEALVDGQIQHISVVTGPSFLGWQHPPVPASAGALANGDPPAPTRPAAVTAAAQ